MKLSKSGLIQLIREQREKNEFVVILEKWFDCDDRDYPPNEVNRYGDGLNLKQALDLACTVRKLTLKGDTLHVRQPRDLAVEPPDPHGDKNCDLISYDISIECPNGNTFMVFEGRSKRSGGYSHTEAIAGSCGKNGWAAKEAPQEYYDNCAPAIAESKDYKRLAKKWLSEGKKISAEKFRGLGRREES
jgi:hypothetical protein